MNVVTRGTFIDKPNRRSTPCRYEETTFHSRRLPGRSGPAQGMPSCSRPTDRCHSGLPTDGRRFSASPFPKVRRGQRNHNFRGGARGNIHQAIQRVAGGPGPLRRSVALHAPVAARIGSPARLRRCAKWAGRRGRHGPVRPGCAGVEIRPGIRRRIFEDLRIDSRTIRRLASDFRRARPGGFARNPLLRL